MRRMAKRNPERPEKDARNFKEFIDINDNWEWAEVALQWKAYAADPANKDLRYAVFHRIDLSNMDLSNCDLSDSWFRDAIIRNTNFENSNLCRAKNIPLDKNSSGANFKNAKVRDATWSSSKDFNVRTVNMEGVEGLNWYGFESLTANTLFQKGAMGSDFSEFESLVGDQWYNPTFDSLVNFDRISQTKTFDYTAPISVTTLAHIKHEPKLARLMAAAYLRLVGEKP